MKKPNLFIVGAPKSGTTATYEYLKPHPEIFMSPVKEPYYFGNDLLYHSFPRKSANEYLSLFHEATNEKWIGEASVTYLVSTRAAQEIKGFNSSARIIIMLRNPIDMMYSMHSQTLFTDAEFEKDFSHALALEECRKQGAHISSKVAIVNLLFYRELARYSEQINRYFKAIGRENVHVVIFDDFKADVAVAYKEILQFLEVNDKFRPDSFEVVNASKRRRNENLLQLLIHPSVVSFVRRVLPSHSLRQQIANNLLFLVIKKEPRPPMDPDLRRRLQKELIPEIEHLSLLLGRDLMHWCQP